MAGSSDVPVSPVVTSKPELTVSAASVNDTPVELDGTPTSAEKQRRGSRAVILEGMSGEEQNKRKEIISERKDDPAVLVDIPKTPGAEELEKSGATEEEQSAADAALKN